MATCLVIGAGLKQRGCIRDYVALERHSGVHHTPLWCDSWPEFGRILSVAPDAFGIVTDGALGLVPDRLLTDLLMMRPSIDIFIYGDSPQPARISHGWGWLVPNVEPASGVIPMHAPGGGERFQSGGTPWLWHAVHSALSH